MSYPTQPPAQSQSNSEGPPALVYPTANDLPEETRVPVVRELNRTLADTTDLASQMKFAHWNVKGMNFYQLHLLFDEIAEVLTEHADRLAERATSLGGQAMGTVRMAASASRIPEIDPGTVTGPEFVQATTDHLAVHAANLRSDIDFAANQGDEDTADLYTELSREVDQQLYFLESHLQTQPLGTADQVFAQHATDTRDGSGGRGQSTTPDRAPQRVTFTGSTQEGQSAGSEARSGHGQVQQTR